MTLPRNLEANLLQAEKTHHRFGKYSDWIDRVRARLEQTPLEKSELEHLAVEEGVPADFDVAQINWKPDYDPFYYQHLLVRAKRLYLFRDQYLFLLPSVLVAETPQAGHATYLFSRPDSLADFFRLYRWHDPGRDSQESQQRRGQARLPGPYGSWHRQTGLG